MPVGGSRHYSGPGVGSEGLWTCPACGEDNAGAIAQGCGSCGAGRPGYRAAERVATSRPSVEDTPDPPRPPDLASRWAAQHPTATIEDAYRAGYEDALRTLRQAAAEAKQRQEAERFAPAGKPTRTMVAALTLFRDQVLTHATEEIASGEWCSVEEVNHLLAQLTGPEAARV